MRITKKRATIHLHSIDHTGQLWAGAVEHLNGITFDQWLRLGAVDQATKAKALAYLRQVNPLKPQWERGIVRG